MRVETRALWELLLTDFTQFHDYRQFKADRGGTASDFKHKETGEGLWWVKISQADRSEPLGRTLQPLCEECRLCGNALDFCQYYIDGYILACFTWKLGIFQFDQLYSSFWLEYYSHDISNSSTMVDHWHMRFSIHAVVCVCIRSLTWDVLST